MIIDNDILEQTVESGIKPLSLVYQNVISTRSEKTEAFRSILKIESLDLGTMMPPQYTVVAKRSTQCEKLCLWNIEHIFADIPELAKKSGGYDWLSIVLPVKLLMKKGTPEKLANIFETNGFGFTELTKIAFEISTDIFYEETTAAAKAIAAIKEMGAQIILEGYGDEFCPMGRLAGLKFDSIILDPYITTLFGVKGKEIIATNTIDFARDLECRTIASGIKDMAGVTEAFGYNCAACVGEVSGRITTADELVMVQ